MAYLNNQPEIDSIDQHQWRAERLGLIDRVKNLCQANNIDFISIAPFEIEFINSIKYSNRDKIVHMWLFDLISDYNYWKKINPNVKKAFVVFTGKTASLDKISMLNWKEIAFIKN